MLFLATLLLSAAPQGPGINWNLSAQTIASTCTAELDRARSRLNTALAPGDSPPALERLIAVETALADLDVATEAIPILSDSATDEAARAAARKCIASRSALTVELQANPALYAVATTARAAAKTPADRSLAQRYAEDGRHGGAALDAKTRAELTALLGKLHALETDFVRTLTEDRPTLLLSTEEAATLPPSFTRSLEKEKKGKGVLVPVALNTFELVLKNLRPSSARERFARAFFKIGGPANLDRLRQALALRRQAAKLLGYQSWAGYRLDVTSARTPEGALKPVKELDAALLPRAREEIATLAALKAAAGEKGPFSLWDYAHYQARHETSSHAVDAEALRQYFPVDVVIPGALGVFEELLGLRFEPVQPANAWASDVLQYAVFDAAPGAAPGTLLGWAYIDIVPKPTRFVRPASGVVRVGRALPGGKRQLPIAVIAGNGPAAAPGERALFTHQGVVEMFHEIGHMAHALLSTAPYASLSGVHVRSDFLEAPSQIFEHWAFDPAILRRVSRHTSTGEPLPESIARKLADLRRASAGAFWTRQAFLATYDLTLNGPKEVPDTTALWFELWAKMTALPPLTGTIPEASLLPQMGGYDATYYGYLWSRAWAADLFTAFRAAGIQSREVGLRYRRTVLEPGALDEPEALLRAFLGRPPSPAAFAEEVGVSTRPPAGR